MIVHYYLRDAKAAHSKIRIRIALGRAPRSDAKRTYNTFGMLLPISVSTLQWNKQRERARKGNGHPEGATINLLLDRIESDLQALSTRLQLASQPITRALLQECIETSLGLRKPEARLVGLPGLLQQLIQETREGRRLKSDGSMIRPNTLRKYTATLYHLKKFEKKYGLLDIVQLNREFGQRLHVYFNEVKLGQNTKATHFNVLRVLANYAVERGLLKSNTFKEVSAPEVLTDAIALSEEEVNRIFSLTIDDPILATHRDVFVFGVWSMLRFEDYSKIKEVNIVDGGSMLKLYSEKMQRPVYVPLHWQLQEILKRHGGALPHLTHLQGFNKSLKILGKMANISRASEIRKWIGGSMQKVIVPRYELISSHTARRTGATLLYLAGVPKKQIMLLTDHLKEQNFDRYVRIDKYSNARMLADHPIFKKSTK